MNIHLIDLEGYYARSHGSSMIYLGTAGSHGNEQLQVTQGKGWEGLTVQVVFHPSKVAVQLPANGLLDVPWEATTQPLNAMQGRIVFQGFDQDRLVNSTDLAYTVASHSATVGRDEEPYTPGIVEGVLNQMAADKDAILQSAQQTSQAKDAAAASANQAAGSAAKAQQSAGAANTSAGQASDSASQAAGSAAAAGETLTQVQTAGQEAEQKVKDAETEALDKIAAAAPALPAVSTDTAWQSVTVKPDGSGYNLAALAPIEATIRPTVTGNPTVCENSAAWGLQGLRIYGKSVQNGTPSPENPVPIISVGDSSCIELQIIGKNILNPKKLLPSDGLEAIEIKSESEFVLTCKKSGVYRQTLSLNTGVFISSGSKVYFQCEYIPSNSENIPIVVLQIFNKGTEAKRYNLFINSSITVDISGEIAAIICLNQANTAQTGDFTTFKNFTLSLTPSNRTFIPYADPQFLTLSVPGGLPGIPATSGNCTDYDGKAYISNYWDFDDGQQHILCDKIAKYNGEAITTPYISSTGALTSGAQVIYVLSAPQTEPIPTEAMEAYRALITYASTTVVSTAEPVAGLEVQYVADGTKYAEKVQSMEFRLAALEAAINLSPPKHNSSAPNKN